ncbi:hypothetical protein [Butyrivibrio proteoclasticus]|uniref:hypothetical protein n=1 Tax=Butyrivibrio proteoclasticus TaxID=43305 RepID=UPI001A9A5270|nr:hypothetical protein [Butyrivibrio proteoclasticus]
MFSNLFHSAITAVYCGTVILFDLIKERSLHKSLKKNLLQVSIVLVWFIVLAFEYSGGRSDSFEQGIDLALSFRQFMTMIGAMSIAYKIIVLLSVIGFIWLLRMKKDVGILPMIIVSGILETAFLLLLNAKVHYMSRVEASWGTWFYLILFCVTVFVYVCKSVGAELDNNIGDDLRDKVFWGSLLTLLIMIVFSWYPDGKFAISSTRNPDYDQCYDTSSYIFNSIVDADRAGQTEMVLKLPKSDRADEFTFVPQIGNTVSNSLYLQGIISHKINVMEEFDESLNERFLPKE